MASHLRLRTDLSNPTATPTIVPDGQTWRRFREDDDSAGWDLDQTRSANQVNEITDISKSVGLSWVTPAYDKAGNMESFQTGLKFMPFWTGKLKSDVAHFQIGNQG